MEKVGGQLTRLTFTSELYIYIFSSEYILHCYKYCRDKWGSNKYGPSCVQCKSRATVNTQILDNP